MSWHSVGDFLAMGGYGLYVWGSYLVCALALAWEAVLLHQRRVRAIEQVREWHSQHHEGDAA